MAGGVSANGILRRKISRAAKEADCRLYMPELRYCGDNAAMIASQGFYEAQAGRFAGLDLNAYATMDIAEAVF